MANIMNRYTTDDPANPQNWSNKKRAFVALQIDLYTFAVYAGSAIYVSSELQVMTVFGVENFKASLPLALYVLGYGIGPLLWSPMSEIPVFGRNIPYIVTVLIHSELFGYPTLLIMANSFQFAIYVILCVPTALVDNLGGLVVLRFLQ